MKSNTLARIFWLVGIFITVLVLALLLALLADVRPGQRERMVWGSLFLAVIFGGFAAFLAQLFNDEVPNGLPRPGDELTRRKLFGVFQRGDNWLLLLDVQLPKEKEPVYWKFEEIPAEVKPGKTVVYLDDLETEYLASWKEKGVIPLLSAEGKKSFHARSMLVMQGANPNS